jgi:hypothetical protein
MRTPSTIAHVVAADPPVTDKPPVEQQSDGGGDRHRVTCRQRQGDRLDRPGAGQIAALHRVCQHALDGLVQGVDISLPNEAAQFRLLASRVMQGREQVDAGSVLAPKGAGRRRNEFLAQSARTDDDRHKVVGESGVVQRLRGELRPGLPAPIHGRIADRDVVRPCHAPARRDSSGRCNTWSV